MAVGVKALPRLLCVDRMGEKAAFDRCSTAGARRFVRRRRKRCVSCLSVWLAELAGVSFAAFAGRMLLALSFIVETRMAASVCDLFFAGDGNDHAHRRLAEDRFWADSLSADAGCNAVLCLVSTLLCMGNFVSQRSCRLVCRRYALLAVLSLSYMEMSSGNAAGDRMGEHRLHDGVADHHGRTFCQRYGGRDADRLGLLAVF